MSKALICGRSRAGAAGSNPTGGHGCLCCVLSGREFSATSWSLVQRSPTYCAASLSVIQKPREWGHGPRLAAAAQEDQQVLWRITRSFFRNRKTKILEKIFPAFRETCRSNAARLFVFLHSVLIECPDVSVESFRCHAQVRSSGSKQEVPLKKAVIFWTLHVACIRLNDGVRFTRNVATFNHWAVSSRGSQTCLRNDTVKRIWVTDQK